LRVRDLLSVPGLGLRLLTDVTGLDRAIKHVYTTDLLDPGRYLTPGDLVLTGMMWWREPGDADRFVTVLAKTGIAVLGAGEALGPVPLEVIQACGRHGVTLLAVPAETSFAVVTEEVGRRLNGDRVTAMSRVLGRRRRLLSAVAEGAGLDAMLGLMGREIGAECWLLTGTGRVVGGTGASLSRPLALQLACEYLRAERLPTVTEAGARLTGPKEYSLFGVGGEPRITGWFLACGGREQDWPHELRESIAELAADVALERARLDASRTGDRKLAEAIIAMLASGGGEGTAPVEIASLMRAIGSRRTAGISSPRCARSRAGRLGRALIAGASNWPRNWPCRCRTQRWPDRSAMRSSCLSRCRPTAVAGQIPTAAGQILATPRPMASRPATYSRPACLTRSRSWSPIAPGSGSAWGSARLRSGWSRYPARCTRRAARGGWPYCAARPPSPS